MIKSWIALLGVLLFVGGITWMIIFFESREKEMNDEVEKELVSEHPAVYRIRVDGVQYLVHVRGGIVLHNPTSSIASTNNVH